jgi:hypothetical protein
VVCASSAVSGVTRRRLTTQVCGTLGIPVVGYLMDHMGFRVTITVTITLGVIWCFLSMTRTESVLILSFAAYALFRSFAFNFFFAYLADQLGFK